MLVIFVTTEQRQSLQQDGAPTPLIDGDSGKCYMVMPVEFSQNVSGLFRARMPGLAAFAEADVPSDAAEALAILLQRMLKGL